MTTNNAVNNGLSGATGSVHFVGSTSPTLVTPTLGAASATSLAFTSTSGVVGTTTNNAAAVGSVGELLSQQVLFTDAISLTSTTPADVTPLSSGAGDWDIWGNVYFNPSIGASSTQCWINTTSATAPDNSEITGLGGFATGSIGTVGISTICKRFSFAVPTEVYLSAVATFASGTMTVCGGVSARRRR